jgi:ribosomal protein L24E
MIGKRFKRYGTGILYIVGNGKVIHFDSEKIDEIHNLIHEREKDPSVLYGLKKELHP